MAVSTYPSLLDAIIIDQPKTVIRCTHALYAPTSGGSPDYYSGYGDI
jgi:hypothetical protein